MKRIARRGRAGGVTWGVLVAATWLVTGAVAAETPSPSSAPASLESPGRVAGEVVNGVLDWGAPSVGFFVNPRDGGVTSCSGTLVGCRTFVTAAHCVCSDFGNGFPVVLPGSECRTRTDLLDPAGKRVFFQHAGFVGVSAVEVHPSFQPGVRSDLAVLRLDRPVTGVRPSSINQRGRPSSGSPGLLMGFGRTGAEENDRGLKRHGTVTFGRCQRAPAGANLCYDFDYRPPYPPPGTDSAASGGDSGGPIFVDLGAGPVLGAVTSGGTPLSGLRFNNYGPDLFVERDWMASAAGADLHATECGDLPFAGEAASAIHFGSGELSAGSPEARFTLEVPPGTTLLRVSLNGESPFTNDLDLYLGSGAPLSPAVADCASEEAGALEHCEVASPAPGTWHVLTRRVGGDGAAAFQVTATLFRSDGGSDPPPPPGAWLASPALPGFEAKVRLNGATPGNAEPDCIAETLCVSGALAGRPEVFLKVIGPRPNGYLWAQISRFTPSRTEVWLRQVANGQVNFYDLPAVGPASDDVPGLQDREAFSPGLEAVASSASP